MAEVVWTREALTQLDLIRAYIGQYDPAAASRLTGKLLKAGESLQDFPNRGRPIEDGLRELPTVAPYVIQYEVDGQSVSILGVWHGSQLR